MELSDVGHERTTIGLHQYIKSLVLSGPLRAQGQKGGQCVTVLLIVCMALSVHIGWTEKQSNKKQYRVNDNGSGIDVHICIYTYIYFYIYQVIYILWLKNMQYTVYQSIKSNSSSVNTYIYMMDFLFYFSEGLCVW